MLILYALLVLASCSQEETNDQFSQEQRKEMIQADPLFANYHKAVEAQTRLTLESETFDIHKYVEIARNKSAATHVCDVDKSIFEGDKEMEQLVELQCKSSKIFRALKDKYPFLAKMTKSEMLIFFKDFDMKYNYDIEAIQAKARKAYEEQLEKN